MSAAKEVSVVENKDAVITKLATAIQYYADISIKKQGYFNLGVSGGSLINFLKDALAEIKSDFSKWRIFFCDERVVSEDSPDSTFGQYKQHLIDKTNIFQESQFVKIKQGVTADIAAADYIQKLKEFFPADTPNAIPRFGLLLLGMGPDGHTCSLFPGHPLLQEKTQWVAPIFDSPKPPPERITLTFPVINNARVCVFVASGQEKADMVKRILVDKEDLPATRVQPTCGKLVWILDKAAGKHVQ